mmetsp:Transcript_96650/g.159183  ORF Transcript_96650/g.159183 Transcript_96650/m.159183 type:complete len:84 (-) Transcript_96650:86-337(-)
MPGKNVVSSVALIPPHGSTVKQHNKIVHHKTLLCYGMKIGKVKIIEEEHCALTAQKFNSNCKLSASSHQKGFALDTCTAENFV